MTQLLDQYDKEGKLMSAVGPVQQGGQAGDTAVGPV